MPIFRRADHDDLADARRLIDRLLLSHPLITPDGLWVAAEGDRVAGVAHLARTGEALFLSSVGVREEMRGKGIGKGLVRAMVGGERRDTYVYTIVPGFFEKLGFVFAEAPGFIPRRGIFGCQRCEPADCRCMVRRGDDS